MYDNSDILQESANFAGIGAAMTAVTSPEARKVAVKAVKEIVDRGRFKPHEWQFIAEFNKNKNLLDATDLAAYEAGTMTFRKKLHYIRKKISASGTTKILGVGTNAPTQETVGINTIENSKLQATMAVSHLRLQYATATTDAALGTHSYANIGNTVPAGLLNGSISIQLKDQPKRTFQIREFFQNKAVPTGVSNESTALEVSTFAIVKNQIIEVEINLPDGVTLTDHHYISVEFIGSEIVNR